MSVSLGIDIGGTFTDLVIHDPRGPRHDLEGKHDAGRSGARRGGGHAAGAGEGRRQAAEQIGRVVHATTLFTNALIERKGARTGLLTTAGFRDVLEIGRERKYELYDLFIEMPQAAGAAAVAARGDGAAGARRLGVEIRLDIDAALRRGGRAGEQGVESLAICFLHAYANPAHERAIGAAVAERFQDSRSRCHRTIAPEIREYLRASTTVANAYIRPLAEIYLERLEQALRDLGHPGGLFSDAVERRAHACRARPSARRCSLLESGPAAGALAGAWFGRNAGLDRVLAFDMGGTTAKLALVDDGEPLVAYGFEAAREKRFLRGSRTADPDRHGRADRDRCRRRLDRAQRRARHAAMSDRRAAAPQPGPACYGRGGRMRPSPTPI